VRPKGSLLLSGILARQAEEILEAYRPSVQHLNPLGVLQEREGWVCIGTRE
jgi:ribosomal protein L11 methyltransferase